MVKIVLDDKEALHAIEDRLQKAVDYVIESNPKLRSSDRKLMRNRLTQLTSCLTLKVRYHRRSGVWRWMRQRCFALPLPHCLRPPAHLPVQIKRNTRLRDDDWSDVEEDEREAKVAKKGRQYLPAHRILCSTI